MRHLHCLLLISHLKTETFHFIVHVCHSTQVSFYDGLILWRSHFMMVLFYEGLILCSLRGRPRSKGKGKGIRARDHAWSVFKIWSVVSRWRGVNISHDEACRLFPRGVIFTRSRFARSPIPEEKWGTTGSLILLFKINSVLKSLLSAFNHFHEMLFLKISNTSSAKSTDLKIFFLRFSGIEH